MSDISVQAVPDRKIYVFDKTQPQYWRFIVKTGSRCNGLRSCQSYGSKEAALKAGMRIVNKITSS